MTSEPVLQLRFVLVRPRNPLNIGAAARAMANFGITDMVAVKPYAPVWRETLSARGAEKLVLAARSAASIDDAIGDCHLVLGTTTLRDRRQSRDIVSLPDVKQWVESKIASTAHQGPYRVAVLFGPEKTGLSGAYLRRCHAWVNIPTDPSCPSMNLGQAVAVCAYEMSQRPPRPIVKNDAGSPALRGDRLERLVRHADEVFRQVGYLTFLPHADRLEKIQRSFLGWSLKERDARVIHGLFRFVQKMGSSRGR